MQRIRSSRPAEPAAYKERRQSLKRPNESLACRAMLGVVDRVYRSAFVLLLALATVSSGAIAIGRPAEPVVVPDHLTMAQLGELYKDEFYNEPAPEGLSPQELQTYWTEERLMQGRSAQDWLDFARTTYDLTTPAPALAGQHDLVASVLRLEAIVTGAPLPAAQVLELQASAAKLDPVVRDALAATVDAVADVYAAQLPLALDLNARFAAEFDIHENFVTNGQRDLMAARAATVLDALKAFNDATKGQFHPTSAACAPTFVDPLFLVYVGNTCDNTYSRVGGNFPDPVLILEPGGNDIYNTYAGGADPAGILAPGAANKLVLAAVFDAAGNDLYSYTGQPATVQGAGAIGAIGILADAAGDDTYYASYTRTGSLSALNGVQYYFDGGGQGYGYGGVGILVDAQGQDTYDMRVKATNGRSIWGFGQGFGGLGGLGIASDAVGDDDWLSKAGPITGGTGGFTGIYGQGSGFYGGTGIATDTAFGNDVWDNRLTSTTTDFYSMGFGAFSGVGIIGDDGGTNDWIAISDASNPWINPLLNCAYGTASLGGYGVMIGMAGDDSYFTDTISPYTAHTMVEGFGGIGAGVGVFVDVGGVDQHVAVAHGGQGNLIHGRGVIDTTQLGGNLGLGEGGNVIGFYLDIGGVDTYVPASLGNGLNVGAKDASTGNGVAVAWANGADINTV